MDKRRRFKLSAGAGLVTMLLGALLVVAPGAGADPKDERLVQRVDICHRTNSVTNPYVLLSVDFSAADGSVSNGPDHYTHAGPLFDFAAVDFDATYPKPRKGDQWGDIIPPIPLAGGGETGGSNWSETGEAIWNNDCNAPGADGGPVVIVEKQVPGIDSEDSFLFSVNGSTPATAIGDGDSEEFSVAIGTVTVAENLTNPAGYTLDDVTCTTADDVDLEVVPVAGAVSFDIASDGVVTCTFSNLPDSGGSRTGSLQIDKVVAGTAAGVQPTDRAYGFSAVCKDSRQIPLTLDPADSTFMLTNLGPAKVIDELPAGAACTIEETVRHSPNGGTTMKVGTAGAVAGFKAEDVAVTAGQTTDVVFTNIYNVSETVVVVDTPTTTIPPAPASLRLNKAVESVGGGEGPETWEAQFEVVGEGVDESRTLDQDVTTARLGDLAVGSYTITELAEEGSTLTDVDCVERSGGDIDVDVLSAGVTVAIDPGENVVCTFTNAYPAVLPGEEVPKPEPKPEPKPAEETPKPKPTTAVLGDVVTRPQTLPRTGDETKGLAGAGVLLVALGATMVLGSRRQLARR